MLNTRVTGKTRLAGIIGNPIEQSMSPVLHNTLAEIFDKDLIYIPFKVEKSKLKEAISGLMALNVIGFNVTIPYKEEIIPFLDDITEDARLSGSVNTVKVVNGKLIGYNTDMLGFDLAFQSTFQDNFSGKRVAILGAGGAGKAICLKIAKEGACEIILVNRTLTKAESTASFVNENFGDVVKPFTLSDSSLEIISKCDIIVNTTSIGMIPDLTSCPLPQHFRFDPHQIAYDIIYKPNETLFLKMAKQAGCRVINGAEMLYYQGIKAFEIWMEVHGDEEKLSELHDLFLQQLKHV